MLHPVFVSQLQFYHQIQRILLQKQLFCRHRYKSLHFVTLFYNTKGWHKYCQINFGAVIFFL